MPSGRTRLGTTEARLDLAKQRADVGHHLAITHLDRGRVRGVHQLAGLVRLESHLACCEKTHAEGVGLPDPVELLAKRDAQLIPLSARPRVIRRGHQVGSAYCQHNIRRLVEALQDSHDIPAIIGDNRNGFCGCIL